MDHEVKEILTGLINRLQRDETKVANERESAETFLLEMMSENVGLKEKAYKKTLDKQTLLKARDYMQGCYYSLRTTGRIVERLVTKMKSEKDVIRDFFFVHPELQKGNAWTINCMLANVKELQKEIDTIIDDARDEMFITFGLKNNA